MRRLSLNRSEPAKKSGQNIPKNRCRTTIPERMVETLAELPALVAAEIVPSGGSAPDAYMFRHALIQDAAYQSLLLCRRRPGVDLLSWDQSSSLRPFFLRAQTSIVANVSTSMPLTIYSRSGFPLYSHSSIA